MAAGVIVKDSYRNFPLFAPLSEKQFKRLMDETQRKQFRNGEVIIQQGVACRHVHILIEGKVEVISGSVNGEEAHIIFQRAPALFGMFEIWKGLPYLGTLAALEPSSTLVLDKAQYLGLLHSSHQLCLSVVQFLCEQLYEDGIDHRVRLFGDTAQILARYLICHAQAYGDRVHDGTYIPTLVNKSHIAKSLGISRRHVIRSFRLLETQSLIQIQQGKLFIPNLESLRKFANTAWNFKEKRRWRRGSSGARAK